MQIEPSRCVDKVRGRSGASWPSDRDDLDALPLPIRWRSDRPARFHVSPRWEDDRGSSRPCDEDRAILRRPRWEENRRISCPSDGDRATFTLMKIGDPRVSTWRPVSPLIVTTYPLNYAPAWSMIAWTRVHAISAVLMESDTHLQSTSPEKGKTVWEHSPTRKKNRENPRLNRGAPFVDIALPSPTITRAPLCPWALLVRTLLCHVASLLGVRVASCHASAPPAPHAGRPWLCHVASVPCRIHALVPRATSACCLGPLATSSAA